MHDGATVLEVDARLAGEVIAVEHIARCTESDRLLFLLAE